MGEIPPGIPWAPVNRGPIEHGPCRLNEARSESHGGKGHTLTQATTTQACWQAEAAARERVINAACIRQSSDSTQQGSINECRGTLREPWRYMPQPVVEARLATFAQLVLLPRCAPRPASRRLAPTTLQRTERPPSARPTPLPALSLTHGSAAPMEPSFSCVPLPSYLLSESAPGIFLSC